MFKLKGKLISMTQCRPFTFLVKAVAGVYDLFIDRYHSYDNECYKKKYMTTFEKSY